MAKTETIMVTVTEIATATATATVPHPASYTSFELFKDTVLSISNRYRDMHNASRLVWNDTLTEYAKNWASGCLWEHSNGPYGENLAFGYPNASAAVVTWGDEGLLYNFDKPTGFTEATGHFTQLVWKGSAEVGCAAVDCGYSDDAKTEQGTYSKAQGYYVVCEYTPAGNVVGDDDLFFRLNVQSMIRMEEGPSKTTQVLSTSTSTGTATTTRTTGTGTVASKAMRIRGMEGVAWWVLLFAITFVL